MSGRSPTITCLAAGVDPASERTSCAIASCGFPAMVAVSCDAYTYDAMSEPPPGNIPVSVGKVASSFVPMRRAPASRHDRPRWRKSKQKSRCIPTTTASKLAGRNAASDKASRTSTTCAPRLRTASMTPGPEHANTVSVGAINEAAA